MRRDPRGEKRKLKPNTDLKCVVCGEQAVWRQWVKLDWFRGNDQDVVLCDEHWKAPRADYAAWLDLVLGEEI